MVALGGPRFDRFVRRGKEFLPDGVVSVLRRPYRSLRRSCRLLLARLFYRGDRVVCPCCGWHGKAFLPAGSVVLRANAECPNCYARERHRLLYLYLTRETTILSTSTRLLHFAPESSLRNIFEKNDNIDYITTDLEDPSVKVQMSITDIQFDNDSFDCILCSHVLEHVPDDRAAMQELLRVLKPSGFAILQVPIKDLPEGRTLEDDQVVSPDERERVFGQRDHVRIYGRDFYDRLVAAGFTVTVRDYTSELGTEAEQKFGLRAEGIYHCTKCSLTA